MERKTGQTSLDDEFDVDPREDNSDRGPKPIEERFCDFDIATTVNGGGGSDDNGHDDIGDDNYRDDKEEIMDNSINDGECSEISVNEVFINPLKNLKFALVMETKESKENPSYGVYAVKAVQGRGLNKPCTDQGGNKPTQASTLAISMSPIRGEEAQTHGGEEERPQLDKGKETDLKIYYYDEMLMEEQE
ncbi:hypothetical protein JHK87_048107 [Glycine soja]|nr:hypothetical protein JHK87_048107 [Glycine soja]